MYLAYRGFSVIVIAPLLALLATFLQGEQGLMGTYTQIFMTSLGSFAVKYFPIFLLGAIFGKLLEVSGSASSIARTLIAGFGKRFTIPAIVLSCGLLTYGGVSAFVVAFSVFPLAAAAFSQAGLPRQLIPGCIALGAFTFSMTCLPGTIQIHNLIPMTYFGTDAYAAPLLGILAGSGMLGAGLWWLQRRSLIVENIAPADTASLLEGNKNEPHCALALAPIVLVIVLNLVLAKNIIPKWDLSYLSDSKFSPSDTNSLGGMWAMILALFFTNVFTIAIHWRRIRNVSNTLAEGAMSSLLPTLNTASEVGYGATIKSLAAFAIIKTWMTNISPNPLITEVASINVLAGITGSAAGGLSIALAALGETFSKMGAEASISPEIMHRLASMASGGLDTLPHNGAVITLLTVCGLSHKQSYKDIAVVSLVIPFLITALSVLVVSLLL